MTEKPLEFTDETETVTAGIVKGKGCNAIEIYNVSLPGVTMYVNGLPIPPGFYYFRPGNNPLDSNTTNYTVQFSNADTGRALVFRKFYKR